MQPIWPILSPAQKRVENYSTEAIVYQEGSDRISIEIPGVTDANAILQGAIPAPGTLYFIAQTTARAIRTILHL